MILRIIFLAGLFLIPLGFLILGHRLRDRTRTQRRMFWWGVGGYLTGMAVAVTAALFPPVMWPGAGSLRGLAVHGGMLVFGALGFLLGGILARLDVS
ncbi:MAG: hypothetical protein R6W82_00280 [bacterium]